MKTSYLIVLALILLSCTKKSPIESKSKSLFNGTDLTGWHVDVPDLEKDSTLRNPFIVRDGLLVSLGTPEGHLITDAVYQNYEIEVEYRFAGEPGNCGLLVNASTPRALYEMFPKSLANSSCKHHHCSLRACPLSHKSVH